MAQLDSCGFAADFRERKQNGAATAITAALPERKSLSARYREQQQKQLLALQTQPKEQFGQINKHATNPNPLFFEPPSAPPAPPLLAAFTLQRFDVRKDNTSTRNLSGTASNGLHAANGNHSSAEDSHSRLLQEIRAKVPLIPATTESATSQEPAASSPPPPKATQPLNPRSPQDPSLRESQQKILESVRRARTKSPTSPTPSPPVTPLSKAPAVPQAPVPSFARAKATLFTVSSVESPNCHTERGDLSGNQSAINSYSTLPTASAPSAASESKLLQFNNNTSPTAAKHSSSAAPAAVLSASPSARTSVDERIIGSSVADPRFAVNVVTSSEEKPPLKSILKTTTAGSAHTNGAHANTDNLRSRSKDRSVVFEHGGQFPLLKPKVDEKGSIMSTQNGTSLSEHLAKMDLLKDASNTIEAETVIKTTSAKIQLSPVTTPTTQVFTSAETPKYTPVAVRTQNSNQDPATQVRKMSTEIKTPLNTSMPQFHEPLPSRHPIASNPILLPNGDEKVKVNEHVAYQDWDPTLLLRKLYHVDYTPRIDKKKQRFVNMEGHLDHLPLGVRNTNVSRAWKPHYFQTRDGRLVWYATPYAEGIPVGEIVLAKADVDVNEEESTLLVHGTRDGSILCLKSPPALLDKWRQSLLNHTACSLEDTYVQPYYPPRPHTSKKIIIVELGSCSIRAGLLTDLPSLPKVFCPSLASVQSNGDVIMGINALAPSKRHSGVLKQPITPTLPTLNLYSFDLNVLRHMFEQMTAELQVQMLDYQVLLTFPQNTPPNLIGDLMRLFLNDLHVQGVAVSKHPTLVLYAYDVTTGVVIDIGDRLNIVPIVDGYVVQNAIVSLPYGGYKIGEELRLKLTEQNSGLYTFLSPVERFVLRYVMEQTCYVAANFEQEATQYRTKPESVDTVVSLEEFQVSPSMLSEFKVDMARFTSPEGLFNPQRWGLDCEGLHKLIVRAIQNAPMDSRRNLYKNIYLAGGATMMPGLAERIEQEISPLVAASIQVQVHQSPWRYHAAYLGAQVFANSAHFSQMVVSLPQLEKFLLQLHVSNF